MRTYFGKSLATSSDPNLCGCGGVMEDDAEQCAECLAKDEAARLEDEEMDAADRAADESLNAQREREV